MSLLLATVLTFISSNAQSNEPFKWGTATASYQVEGAVNRDGRLPCIWDVFCADSNKVYMNESGAVADDDYDRFLEDIELMKSLNLTNYRLSFAWPRILPDGVTPNQEGIAHYQKVITALLQNNIQPFVTLYHWDLPQAVYEATNGGWINESIVDYYVQYVDTVFTYFAPSVKKWLTFNEPWTFCVQGYDDNGGHAPGRCSDRSQCPQGNSSTEPYLCTHNVLLSHAAAVKLFREKQYDKKYNSEIGITLNVDWAEPASSSDADFNASQRKLIWQLAWYADPIWFGDYPQIMKDYIGDRLPTFTNQQKQDLKGSHDFFGLNHYTTAWVQDDQGAANASVPDWNTDQRTNVNAYNQYNGTVIGAPCDSPWLFVVPWGIYNMVKYVDNRYNHPPIYITENGVDVINESSIPLPEVLNDTFRINFYDGYISNVLKAKSEGVDVRGYFAWSLMDNFEWADGYSKRFGIHYVDYNNNLTRYRKASANWFSNITQNNPMGDYQVHLRLAS
eukprot:CAMPEP_0201569066 /NCGR_PEP_ID=MMETSP0190_2-20130828/10541_1 /ASSEMBLY_ACC=CAM_ASM_000263 /TAXON_ID=37353 /ORGANISM="Rosalina sp." /LENGTH=503 /DNA_ID=CAMNT_0047990979 /DNA_START=33 /DNA_END=1547 /DNA_ORIENTATION=+